ncbi:MAG: hypothetical protein J6C04_05605 [Oscillospiraceae bacterium]|nr:hypothetical protein [Oscillospiraceae bacterium]
MYKIVGIIFIVISSYMIFNRTILENYYTYKFLKMNVTIVQKILFEKNANMVYEEIFSKLKFDWKNYISVCKKNNYIKKEEIDFVNDFFSNLGKRDTESEEKYIQYYLEKLITKQDIYYKQYCKDNKIYGMCGISLGLFIIIFLI